MSSFSPLTFPPQETKQGWERGVPQAHNFPTDLVGYGTPPRLASVLLFTPNFPPSGNRAGRGDPPAHNFPTDLVRYGTPPRTKPPFIPQGLQVTSFPPTLPPRKQGWEMGIPLLGASTQLPPGFPRSPSPWGTPGRTRPISGSKRKGWKVLPHSAKGLGGRRRQELSSTGGVPSPSLLPLLMEKALTPQILLRQSCQLLPSASAGLGVDLGIWGGARGAVGRSQAPIFLCPVIFGALGGDLSKGGL